MIDEPTAPPPLVLTPSERELAELVYQARSDAQMADALHVRVRDVRKRLARLGLRLPGPGTARARIVRCMRGERDAANRQVQRDMPLPWLVDSERRAA